MPYSYENGMIEKYPQLNFFYSNPLALDYAAHVGVVFACLKSGTRQQKMQQTLE